MTLVGIDAVTGLVCVASEAAGLSTTGGQVSAASLGVGLGVVLTEDASVHDVVADGDDSLASPAGDGQQHRYRPTRAGGISTCSPQAVHSHVVELICRTMTFLPQRGPARVGWDRTSLGSKDPPAPDDVVPRHLECDPA